MWFVNGILIANGTSLVMSTISRQIKSIELVRLVADSKPFAFTNHIKVTTLCGEWGIFESNKL